MHAVGTEYVFHRGFDVVFTVAEFETLRLRLTPSVGPRLRHLHLRTIQLLSPTSILATLLMSYKQIITNHQLLRKGPCSIDGRRIAPLDHKSTATCGQSLTLHRTLHPPWPAKRENKGSQVPESGVNSADLPADRIQNHKRTQDETAFADMSLSLQLRDPNAQPSSAAGRLDGPTFHVMVFLSQLRRQSNWRRSKTIFGITHDESCLDCLSI